MSELQPTSGAEEVAPEEQLATANRRLAALLGSAAVALSSGGERSLADRLWVWGVLGGKEVGKTSLVNALAGGRVVDPGDPLGEGTRQPAVYGTATDEAALRARFDGGPEVVLHADAPPSLRGLALVDLPDFDSVFADHAEQVREIAIHLDGIVWLSTPRKIEDLRSIREIRRVLKDRCNFLYAVNKIDWLLAQTDSAPDTELRRLEGRLAAEIGGDDGAVREQRCYLISARHADEAALVPAIAAARGTDEAAVRSDEGLMQGIRRLDTDFAKLRAAMTTAPAAVPALARKRRNLDFQIQRQARDLLDYYAPGRRLERLDLQASRDRIAEAVGRSLTPRYGQALAAALQPRRQIFSEWTRELFTARIAAWPLLGIIAWPALALSSAVGGLRSLLPGAAEMRESAFRVDGVSLEERLEAPVESVASALRAFAPGADEVPSVTQLAGLLRAQALATVAMRRDACIASLLSRRPGWWGRSLRSLIPLVILLWFPLLQPLLAALLPTASDAGVALLDVVTRLVGTLSGAVVLEGLAASLLLFAVMTAAIYAGSVQRVLTLLTRLEADELDEPLVSVLVASAADELALPVERLRSELTSEMGRLEALAAATDPTGIPG